MPTLMPVLAVDDSAPIREMIRAVLSAQGVRVSTAADGRDAVQRLRATAEPHIVLLDLVMPLLDGLGVVREIEADPQLSAGGHRVVLMSSTVRLTAPDIPLEAALLVKPFTRQQLIAAVEAMQHMQQ